MTGQTHNLGPYLLDGVLGRGGGSRVWRARHRSGGPRVAIKILESTPSDALREAHAIGGLDHPNIVTLLDFGLVPPTSGMTTLTPGSPYLVMELAAGGSLGELRHRLPWPQLRDVLLTTLEALAHAHARGVIHLDLKPANVLLRAPGGVWRDAMLADFGVSRITRAHDPGSPTFAGTPAYMSPEQIRGDTRRLGPSSDLYSLGCLAWHMMCSAPPYGSRPDEALRGHLSSSLPTFKPRAQVPDRILQWLLSLLDKDTNNRLSSAADAARELLSLDSFSGASVRLSGWGERAFGRRELLLHPHFGPRLLRSRSHPFTGRKELRELADELLTRSMSGSPAILSIEGHTGIGKTRAAHWISTRAHELGRARMMKCISSKDPLEHIVTNLLKIAPHDSAAARSRARRLAAHEDAELAEADADSIEALVLGARGDRALDALSRTLERAARAQTTLVWLDEHALDPITRRWLERFMELELDARVLFILSAHAPFEAATHRVTLAPLAPLEHAAFINALLPLSPHTRRALERVTRGHPRATLEILSHWIAQGSLAPGEQGWERCASACDEISDYARACALRARSALAPTPEAELALRVGAALGSRLDEVEWITCCAQMGYDLSAQTSSTLVRVGALIPMERGWQWAHDAFVEGLRERDPQLHGTIADTLEQIYGANFPPISSRIARHRRLAEQHDASLRASVRAIGYAGPRGDARALIEAAQSLQAASERVSDTSRADLMRGLTLLARAHALRGEHDTAIAHARSIEGTLAGEAMARALLELGHPLRAARALADATPEPERLENAPAARSLCMLARIAIARAQFDAAYGALRRARARAAHERDPQLHTDINLCAARLCAERADELGAREHLQRARDRVAQDATIDLARIHLTEAILALRLSDAYGAREHATIALELARKSRASEVNAFTLLADAALIRGDLDDLHIALAGARSAPHLEPLTPHAMRLDLIEAMSAAKQGARPRLERALGRCLEALDSSDVAHADLARRARRTGDTCLDRGFIELARASYIAALEQWTRLDSPRNMLEISGAISSL